MTYIWRWYFEGGEWIRRSEKAGYELSDPVNPWAPIGLLIHPMTGEPADPAAEMVEGQHL